MGLILTRRIGERIFIGDGISVRPTRISGGEVRLEVVAPPDLVIVREELSPGHPMASAPLAVQCVGAEGGAA